MIAILQLTRFSSCMLLNSFSLLLLKSNVHIDSNYHNSLASHVLSFQWEQFLDLGKDKETSEIEEAMKNQKPNQCATLVYTVSHTWLCIVYLP